MNDSVNFLGSIEYPDQDISFFLIKCFDELMVLYNLIGCRDGIQICANNDNGTVEFIISAKSATDAERLFSHMNNNNFAIYGNHYNIIMIKESKNKIRTKIVRVS